MRSKDQCRNMRVVHVIINVPIVVYRAPTCHLTKFGSILTYILTIRMWKRIKCIKNDNNQKRMKYSY